MSALQTSDPTPRQRSETLRRWMHEELHELPTHSRVLALGCDEAFLASQLADYATDVTVLDTSSGELAQLAPRFPEISFLPHALAKPLPFAAGAFDVVWCSEYLDRVFEPAAALAELHRVLAPGGRLLVAVAATATMTNVWRTWFSRETPNEAAAPRVRYFTRRALSEAVRQAGFGEVHVTSRRHGTLAGPASRSLLLRARKSAGIRLPRPSETGAAAVMLGEQLAFASRARAA
jgi:ubiquinone/menaquinone biosynthesis C-methylase UbiE